MTNYRALLWRNKATESALHSGLRNSRQQEPWAMGPFSSAHVRHHSHHPRNLSLCVDQTGGLVGTHQICYASNKDGDQLMRAFRQRNTAQITQQQCGNVRFFCFFCYWCVWFKGLILLSVCRCNSQQRKAQVKTGLVLHCQSWDRFPEFVMQGHKTRLIISTASGI